MGGRLLTLFVFWEGTSITSYLLIAFKTKDPASLKGGRTAFVVTGLGGLAMLAGFGAVLLVGMAAYGFAGLAILLVRFEPG